MTWEPHCRLLTVEEAARSVERPASTIRRWLAEGRLAAYAFAWEGARRRPLILESHLLECDADTARNTRGPVGTT